MDNIPIRVGNKIEMTMLKDYAGKEMKEKKNYTSQLLELVSERIAKIAMPIYKGKVIPLNVGEEHTLCFYTGSGLFQCKAKIKERYKEGNMFILLVSFLSELEKTQKRNFYRISYTTDVRIRVVTAEEKILEKSVVRNEYDDLLNKEKAYERLMELQGQWETLTINDLSGGGARLRGKLQFEQSEDVILSIPLFGMGERKYKGNVVACYRIPNESATYEIRVEFTGMSPAEREHLIQCIFQEQRKRLKK